MTKAKAKTPDPQVEHLAARESLIRELIRLRQASGLSTYEVGKKMRMPTAAVDQFEKQANWYLGTIQQYANAIGATLHVGLRIG